MGLLGAGALLPRPEDADSGLNLPFFHDCGHTWVSCSLCKPEPLHLENSRHSARALDDP